MAASRYATTQYMSGEFVESAGAIIFHLSKKQICLVRLKSRDEWLLPKGRRKCGESLSEAALREAREETGFRCCLLPVTMPKPGIHRTPVHVHEGICEPVAVTIRELSGIHNVKLIFWYIAAIDGPNGEEIGAAEDQFEVGLFDYEDVLMKLTFQGDRDIVQGAMGIVCNKSDVPDLNELGSTH
ncbi:hypothetical protein MMC26_003867 [Xylographa opegraphella]|nr:hypothetical protein [Xylographa opegraphella]